MVELLAPAGSREALVAAVESGANAVYLAGNMFGARASAENFDRAGLKEAIRFAHLRGVLINVTVNTIAGDDELEELASYLKFLYEAGADAVLVQDLGVARLAREVAPYLPLHASTQMTVHSLEGVRALEEIGFTRVVLAREMSLTEIRAICKGAKAEIEVFMHGALCVCYSGQCLMSSLIGARSGNRGRCAQPCRLPYTLVDEKGEDVLKGEAGKYLLSPRDLNTIEIIPELIKAGVASLKIEGRMKRPEYVATVVGTYRSAIDRYEEGRRYEVTQEERNNLTQIFNRDFTTAYLLGWPGLDMMSDRRPNNRGLLVGRVERYDMRAKLVTVKLSGKIALGDEIDFWVKVGGRVTAKIKELRDKSGQSLESAEGTVVSFPLEKRVHPHDRLFKVYDARLMEKAQKSYKSGAPIRRMEIKAKASASIGEPFKLTLTDTDGHTASAQTEVLGAEALKRPLTREAVLKQVSRLGTSVFELKELETKIIGNVMIPLSEINEARRICVEELERQRLSEFSPFKKLIEKPAPWPQEKRAENTPPARLMVSVDSLAKAEAALKGGADGLLFGAESYEHRLLRPEDYREALLLARKSRARIDFNMPRILRMEAEPYWMELLALFEELRPNAIHVHNIGELHLVRRLTTLAIHADFSLISFNHLTLEALCGLGVSEATASPELSAKELSTLAAKSPIPLTAIAHGRLELMISEYCAVGSFLGGAKDGKCTGACRKGHYFLKDRMGALFPLVTDEYCRMHVLNSKTLSMLPHAMKFKAAGIATLRLEAKYFSEREITDIVRAYNEAMALPPELGEAEKEQLVRLEGKDITRGHYFRGVM